MLHRFRLLRSHLKNFRCHNYRSGLSLKILYLILANRRTFKIAPHIFINFLNLINCILDVELRIDLLMKCKTIRHIIESFKCTLQLSIQLFHLFVFCLFNSFLWFRYWFSESFQIHLLSARQAFRVLFVMNM